MEASRDRYIKLLLSLNERAIKASAQPEPDHVQALKELRQVLFSIRAFSSPSLSLFMNRINNGLFISP